MIKREEIEEKIKFLKIDRNKLVKKVDNIDSEIIGLKEELRPLIELDKVKLLSREGED